MSATPSQLETIARNLVVSAEHFDRTADSYTTLIHHLTIAREDLRKNADGLRAGAEALSDIRKALEAGGEG